MNIHESAENYLEAILALGEKGAVRSIDVANFLAFSKPSVSRAMSLLRENGYVRMDEDGFLSLTQSGHEIADKIYERHKLLTKWLTALGVDPAVAVVDACKIEHDLSSESFQRLKEFVARLEAAHGCAMPGAGAD